jgi:PKHD-type hydroxylase
MIQAIPPYNPPGQDSFAYWENFFSLEELDQIAGLPYWDEAKDAKVGGGGNGVHNPDIRRSRTAWIPRNEETRWIWDRITNTLGEVNSNFFRFDLSGCYEPIQLGLYTEEDQGCYEWHIDASVKTKTVPRKLSMALLLSDPSEFEGGQLQLKMNNDDPVSVEQAKGRAWFFAAYTLHRVTPVTKGVRKSLVVWAGGPQFK